MNPKEVRIIFMGTPDFAVASLRALVEIKHMLKDARFMLAAAAARKVELPVTAAAEGLMAKSERCGYGDKDLTVILQNLTEAIRR